MENSSQEEIQLKRRKTHYKKFAKWYELVMTKITEDEVLITGHEAIFKPEWLEKKILHHPLKIQHVHKLVVTTWLVMGILTFVKSFEVLIKKMQNE